MRTAHYSSWKHHLLIVNLPTHSNMKIKLQVCLFIIGIFIPGLLHAQFFSLLVPDQLSYFQESGGINHYAKVQQVSGTFPRLYELFQPDTLKYNYDDATTAGFWISPVIQQLDSFSWEIYTKQGDSLPIHTDSQLGDEWLFYTFPGDSGSLIVQHIWTGFDSLPAIGVDIVKGYKLQLVDAFGNAQTSSWDTVTFAISQHHGFWESLNFWHFPSQKVYTLEVQRDTAPENWLMGARDVYDFEPGDEFYVEQYDPYRFPDTTILYYKIKGDPVDPSPNSLVYTILKRQFYQGQMIIDTTFDTTFSALSMTSLPFTFPSRHAHIQQGVSDSVYMTIGKDSSYGGQMVCYWSEDLDFTYWRGFSIAGVGFFYVYRFIDPAEDWILPLYFKKEGVEWGTRPVGNGIVSLEEPSILPTLSMYPNPASSFIQMDMQADEWSDPLELVMWNIQGAQLKPAPAGNHRWSVAGMAAGLYLAVIHHQGRPVGRQWLQIQAP